MGGGIVQGSKWSAGWIAFKLDSRDATRKKKLLVESNQGQLNLMVSVVPEKYEAMGETHHLGKRADVTFLVLNSLCFAMSECWWSEPPVYDEREEDSNQWCVGSTPDSGAVNPHQPIPPMLNHFGGGRPQVVA